VTVVAAATVTLAGDNSGADVESGPTTEPPTSSSAVPAVEDLGPVADAAAGTAVVIDDQLVLFGPDGRRGETLSLAPLTGIQAVTSDRHGGWIACGDPPGTEQFSGEGTTAPTITVGPDDLSPTGETPATTPVDPADDAARADQPQFEEFEEFQEFEERANELAAELAEGDAAEVPAPSSNAWWFRPGRAAEPLRVSVGCFADGLGVTEVGGTDVLVYLSMAEFALKAYELVTGNQTTVPVGVGGLSPGDASVGGGRLATFGADGLRVWDLATGDEVPTGPVDLPWRAPDATTGPVTTSLVLAPDGETLAAQIGEVAGGPSDIVVIDLASGEELLRRQVPVTVEGSEVAYDGTTVAIGSYYDGQVHLFDVGSGTERTLDAHGLLP
jgi:hypothetical protein